MSQARFNISELYLYAAMIGIGDEAMVVVEIFSRCNGFYTNLGSWLL
jgi:hypothetical protein